VYFECVLYILYTCGRISLRNLNGTLSNPIAFDFIWWIALNRPPAQRCIVKAISSKSKPTLFSTLLLLPAPFCVVVKNEFSWSGVKMDSFSIVFFAPIESRFHHKVFVGRLGSRYRFMYRRLAYLVKKLTRFLCALYFSLSNVIFVLLHTL
jgi:hypothetical protein